MLEYINHLKHNWKAAITTKYHVSVGHTINDVVEHFVHGLVPCIKWNH